MSAKRVLRQHRLGLRRQCREPLARIGDPGRQPDPRLGRNRVHAESPRISRASAKESWLPLIHIRWPPAKSLWMWFSAEGAAGADLVSATISTGKDRASFAWGRIKGIAQPFEDQVRVHRVAPRHLSHGNARRRRLQADRPLLPVRSTPLHPTRHAVTILSTIVGGHDQPLSPRGRAVRPDACAWSAQHQDKRNRPMTRN